MPNIKEIAGRITSVYSTQQITKAMKMVAAAKLAKRQNSLLQFRPYAYKLTDILMQVIEVADKELLPNYIQQRPIKKLLLVVISADKGLCGSFSAHVVKKAWETIEKFNFLSVDHIDLLMIGKKAYSVFQKYSYKLITDYISLTATLHQETVKEATDFLINAFNSHLYDRIELVYNVFGSVASREVCIEQFLPIIPQSAVKTIQQNYIYEPSVSSISQQLIPLYLNSQLYKALLESVVAENGARMTTMSKATDNADNLLKTLRITYNKTRQAAITNEIIEIAAGAESLKS